MRMATTRRHLCCALAVAALVAGSAGAVGAQDIVGDWQGSLRAAFTLRLVVHVTTGPSGLAGTIDSLDDGVTGIPLVAVALTGTTLTFSVPSLRGSFTGVFMADGSISGAWTQGVRAAPLVLTRVMSPTQIELHRPQTPAPPFPYREEDVSYESAPGVRLAATLTLPAGPGPFPAVVLITGSGPQDRDATVFGHKPFRVLADHLARHGIAVLRADDRGVAKSTGTYASATSDDFAADAEAGFGYLGTRPEVNARRRGLLGHSEGGLVASMVAARNPSVAFVVLLAGTGLPGDEVLLSQSRLIAEANGTAPETVQRSAATMRKVMAALKSDADSSALEATLQEQLRAIVPEAQMPGQIATLTSPWYRHFVAYDPAPALRNVHCPVLALGGDRDAQVATKANLAAIRAALKAGGNTRVQTEELSGLNHLFQHAATGAPAEYGRIEETMAPSVLAKIADWIARQ